jgi:hypothetical protein
MPTEVSTEITALLKDFLEKEKARSEGGITLEKLYNLARETSESIAKHYIHDNERFEAVRKQLASHDSRIVNVEDDIKQLKVARSSMSQAELLALLPPMRDREDTGHGFEDAKVGVKEGVTADLEKKFKAQASMTPGPGVGASPEALTAIVAATLDKNVDAAIDKLRESEKAKRDAEELARLQAAEKKKLDDAENERKDAVKRRRDSIAQVIVGLILAALVAAGGVLWAGARHDAGLAEGRAETPKIVNVPVPVPISVPATAAPAK